MTFSSTPFEPGGIGMPQSRLSQTASPDPYQVRQHLHQWLVSCREATLALFDDVDPQMFSSQAHPDFSPVGWHLGHIAYTEAYWILQHSAGLPPQFSQYQQLFAADGLPKAERQNLPPLDDICEYLDAVRRQVLGYLEVAPIDQQERLWRWLLLHESQHNETITLVLQLQRWRVDQSRWRVGDRPTPGRVKATPTTPSPHQDMVQIPAGYFERGSNALDALDNERLVHPVYLDTYWIDRYPVTCQNYRQFMAAGGYQNSDWWSEAGWAWLQANPVAKPLYWADQPEWDHHPVCGVSWYEAEAYATYTGKRLPTEAEWEKAASWHPDSDQRHPYPWGAALPTSHHCNHDHWIGHTTPVDAYPAGGSAYGCYDMLGNVWEWTADWFAAYEGFKPYLYAGYSQIYFDDQHRVLRGGSWATRPWALRSSFRNWYHPGVRQILAGFRCARGQN